MLAWAHGAIESTNPLMTPRRRGGDHSIVRGTAAEYSPATNTPPTNRRIRIRAIVPAPSTSWVGVAAIASAHAAVPAIAIRVVFVRPMRSAIRPKTIPPTGRPNSIATTMRAPVEAVAVGPASTPIAGASAVRGRNTWMLSIQFPTTPARRAERPSRGRPGSDSGVIPPPPLAAQYQHRWASVGSRSGKDTKVPQRDIPSLVRTRSGSTGLFSAPGVHPVSTAHPREPAVSVNHLPDRRSRSNQPRSAAAFHADPPRSRDRGDRQGPAAKPASGGAENPEVSARENEQHQRTLTRNITVTNDTPALSWADNTLATT